MALCLRAQGRILAPAARIPRLPASCHRAPPRRPCFGGACTLNINDSRAALRCGSSDEERAGVEVVDGAASPPEATSAAGGGDNGAAAPGKEAVESAAMTVPELVYTTPNQSDASWTKIKLAFALPWRRFKQGSVLTIELGGALPEKVQGRFSPVTSLPVLTSCLRKAALDPRVAGVYLKITPLSLGWGKLTEIKRHLEYFKASGKFLIAYMDRGGEKEYYLACTATELYVPPTASVSLRGFSVQGTFLRGVLDKVGVEPQVKRIGAYKSAGDQLLRTDMSPEQAEQLDALLDDIYEGFCSSVAAARGKSVEEVKALLDAGVFDMEVLEKEGWVDGLKYGDEIRESLKKLTGGKDDEVAAVPLRKYASVNASAFVHGAKKVIAIIRASGAIVGGSGSPAAETITADEVIRQVRAAKENKKVTAVVLRVDSGGGDALASDLMWREIGELAKVKPVIASMADVAASGGYYMSMAARKVVAEALTITGSIGVVTGKFNLAGVFDRVGYNKVVLSRGKYAEVFTDNRPFNPDEEELFDKAAQFAYESFRNRAAASRGMAVEDMQAVAQGRVWSGQTALKIGLVDALGGINRALLLAKEAAGIDLGERVRVLELSRGRTSPLQLLSGGGAAALAPLLQQLLAQRAMTGVFGMERNAAGLGAAMLLNALGGSAGAAEAAFAAQALGLGLSGMAEQPLGSADGQPRYEAPNVTIEGAGSAAAARAAGSAWTENGIEL